MVTDQLDPKVKPFHKPSELVEYGFGDHKTILDAIRRGEIPCTRVGRKLLIPTAWVRRQILPDEAAS